MKGSYAWAALGFGIAAYDLAAPKDEQLSDTSRRLTRSHPVLSVGLIGVTALHLWGVLPPQVDPYHLAGALLQSAKGAL